MERIAPEAYGLLDRLLTEAGRLGDEPGNPVRLELHGAGRVPDVGMREYVASGGTPAPRTRGRANISAGSVSHAYTRGNCLRWGDLDLLAGLVRVERAIVRGKITTPKTPVAPHAGAWPDGTRRRGGAVRRLRVTDDDDLVFGHPRLGTPLDPARLGREYMRPALREAGIRESFRPWHDLRHTALTFSAAVNPGYVVKAQAGHSSMQVTDRYVSLATALLTGAAEKSEALLFAGDPGPSVQETCRRPEPETVPSTRKALLSRAFPSSGGRI